MKYFCAALALIGITVLFIIPPTMKGQGWIISLVGLFIVLGIAIVAPGRR